jgi:hypothetical protein
MQRWPLASVKMLLVHCIVEGHKAGLSALVMDPEVHKCHGQADPACLPALQLQNRSRVHVALHDGCADTLEHREIWCRGQSTAGAGLLLVALAWCTLSTWHVRVPGTQTARQRATIASSSTGLYCLSRGRLSCVLERFRVTSVR